VADAGLAQMEQYEFNQNLAAYHRGQLNSYDRAYATCLTGRGYTVQ
jgi:hypothetical protein